MQNLKRLLDIMAALRDRDNGCPWDRKQDFNTIAPYTIEEAYEVADAIDRQDYDQLKDELGDLLFQVVYHAQMADEINRFSFAEVVDAINDKMIRRHPHVFSNQDFKNETEVKANWERQKAKERSYDQDSSQLAGVALSLPALKRAEKLQKRASLVGFDWPEIVPVIEKIHEELAELKQAGIENDKQAMLEELGDLLFACVNLARHYKINPEEALRLANRKFETRFRGMEAKLSKRNRQIGNCSLEELDRLWEDVKSEEK